MKKCERVFLVVLCVLIALTIFAGCDLFGSASPSDSSNGSDSNSTSSGGSTSTNTPTGSTGSGNSSSVSKPSVTLPDPVVNFCVRTETVTITDSGRAYQAMDVVYLSEKMDVNALAAAGYTTLKVKISMEVKEVDDGYQWIFLYSNSSCSKKALADDVIEFVAGVKVKDDPSLLCGKRFEHGAGKKLTSWGTHEFEFNIPLEDLSKDLYIRYGASGSWNDNWQNKNVYISYEVMNNKSSTSTSGGVPVPVVDFCVRSETVTITDSGRANQAMDVVYLSEKMDVKALVAAGYTTLKVKITMEVKEIDDGYQWIFLYSDSSCSKKALADNVVEIVAGVQIKDDPSLLCGKRFEHGAGKKLTSWGTHEFEFNIPLADLKKDLYIRYGASGSWDDDWQNKNVYISYQVTRNGN